MSIAASRSRYLTRQGWTLFFSCPSNGALLQLCILGRQERASSVCSLL